MVESVATRFWGVLMALLLFIDDDPYTLTSLAKATEVLGHRAITAGSGKQALQLLTQYQPDIIFIDMYLPDVEGPSLLKDIQRSQVAAEIPIYILSASPAADVSDSARDAGAAAFLSKPIRLQTITEIIRKHTQSPVEQDTDV